MSTLEIFILFSIVELQNNTILHRNQCVPNYGQLNIYRLATFSVFFKPGAEVALKILKPSADLSTARFNYFTIYMLLMACS